MLPDFTITSSKALFLCCISFIVGISLQSFLQIPQLLAWGFLLLGVGLVVAFFFAKKELLVAGFCCLLLVLGVSRLQVSGFQESHDALAELRDRPEKITLEGTVTDDADVRDASQKLTVRIKNTDSVVLVTAGKYPQYHYLDKVQVTGKLKTPAMFDDFNYQDYLRKAHIYSVMDFPVVELLAVGKPVNPPQFVYQKILWFKQQLKTSISMQFAPPHSSIVEGMLLGTTSGMSQQVKDKFSVTGLTHLMAISGSNVVILSNILISFLLLLGLWRKQALYLSAGFIWLYVTIAGFPASGIRAAIMASIFLLAQAFGRGNTVSRVIVLAAAVMLLQNPLLLRYDIGFQLSFLAALGIIYGKPLLDMALGWCVKKIQSRRPQAQTSKESVIATKAKTVWDIFSVTLAAQLFTLPIIAFNFNNISLVAPITNLLVIPIVDLVMIFGFLAAFAGMFSGILGFVLSLPAYLLLLYFMKVIDVFSGPWAAVNVQSVSWFWLVVYYVAVVALLRTVQKINPLGFLGENNV